MIDLVFTIFCGVIVGLSLGLTGGGGSNFAVPLLIFAIGLTPAQAVPVSLAAVAIVAAAGAVHAVKKGLVFWRPTIVFAVGGMLGAPLGLRMASGMDGRYLVIGFALLALMVGGSMWWRTVRYPRETSVVRALPESGADSSGPVCRLAEDGQLRFSAPCSVALAVAGVLTGLLSGFFGVGGGFIIVPVLLFITHLGIHSAIATSLVVITLTGLAGTAYAFLHGSVYWPVLIPFVIGGLSGMLLGRRWATRIGGPQLQQFFATTIVLMAVAMLIHAVFF